ncbi:MAG: DNA-binding transcriptional LysR family regulator [Reinekea sp.]|jgi:DNA-binding transcriptional LysR family regulator
MTTPQQISRLLIFTEVMKQGSFTKAAIHLGMTKSAVSQNISRLEADLNSRLLNRTTRGISATPLGERLYSRSSMMADQADYILEEIANDQASPSGQFSITYPHALEANIVLPAIEQLSLEFPKLTFRLVADDQALDLVTHNLDAAIHVGELADSSYRALPIGELNEWFCATPQYLNEHDEFEIAEDIERHRWITTPWQKRKFTLTNVKHLSVFSLKPTAFIHAHSFPGVLHLVQSHIGFGLLPNINVQTLIRNKQLVRVLPDWTGPRWPVYLLHAYQSERPVHIRRFHQLIKQYFENCLR